MADSGRAGGITQDIRSTEADVDLEGEQRAITRADVAGRAFDLVVGTLLLLLALPLIAVLAVGSAVSLRAWPFFVQDRIGRNGTTFRFIKIRTLPPTTNKYADKYALAEVEIPAFTRALRALHLDELPQLLLVVTGHMSLVGPRPEMPGLTAQLPRHFATARSLVRPGCTGLWQVGAGCDGLIAESPEYDLFYVQQRSVRFDLWIMVQTARKVLRGGRTELTLADVPTWALPGGGAALPAADRESALDRIVIDLAALTAPTASLDA